MALPWPPGSKSEPSCSQRSQGTSPSELLLLMPDLTPSQSSFVLLGVGADLTHSWGPGSSVRASTTGSCMPHGHCSPQGPGQGAAACPSVSRGICTGKLCHRPGKHDGCPSAQRGVSRGGPWAGSAVFGSYSSSGFCFHPPAALHRLTLELGLIFLARPVILNSGRSTFQSILGTTTAQLGQLHPCGGPEPQGLRLTKPFGTVVVFLFFQFILSPNR